jgi:hypothetical protein
MRVIHLKAKAIVGWTTTELTYRDAHGTLHQINFANCSHQFAKYILESGDFPHRSAHPSSNRCVAIRNTAANPPYIEFFSEPRTRFEFEQPQNWLIGLLQPAKRHWYSDFLEVQRQINAVGWTSYDFS